MTGNKKVIVRLRIREPKPLKRRCLPQRNAAANSKNRSCHPDSTREVQSVQPASSKRAREQGPGNREGTNRIKRVRFQLPNMQTRASLRRHEVAVAQKPSMKTRSASTAKETRSPKASSAKGAPLTRSQSKRKNTRHAKAGSSVKHGDASKDTQITAAGSTSGSPLAATARKSNGAIGPPSVANKAAARTEVRPTGSSLTPANAIRHGKSRDNVHPNDAIHCGTNKSCDAKIPDDTIHENLIRKNTIRDSAIRNNAMRGDTVRDSALHNEAIQDSASRYNKIRKKKVAENEIHNRRIPEDKIREDMICDKSIRDSTVRKNALHNDAICTRTKAIQGNNGSVKIRGKNVWKNKIHNGSIPGNKVRKSMVRSNKIRDNAICNKAIRNGNNAIRDITVRNNTIGNEVIDVDSIDAAYAKAAVAGTGGTGNRTQSPEADVTVDPKALRPGVPFWDYVNNLANDLSAVCPDMSMRYKDLMNDLVLYKSVRENAELIIKDRVRPRDEKADKEKGQPKGDGTSHGKRSC